MVGQPPQPVEQYDDMNIVNDLLRYNGRFDLPKSCLVSPIEDAFFNRLKLPTVAKSVQGRGSHGVVLCRTVKDLSKHAGRLLEDSSPVHARRVSVRRVRYVTILPPSSTNSEQSALPGVVGSTAERVLRTCNEVVAVIENSSVPSN